MGSEVCVAQSAPYIEHHRVKGVRSIAPHVQTKEICPVKSKAIAMRQDHHQARRLLMAFVTTLAVACAMVLAQVTFANAQNRPETFADLAEQISPSVANITTSTTIAGRTGPRGLVPEASPFEDFFNDLDRGPGEGMRRSS